MNTKHERPAPAPSIFTSDHPHVGISLLKVILERNVGFFKIRLTLLATTLEHDEPQQENLFQDDYVEVFCLGL